MADDTTTLTVAPREVAGSRATRRLRREGRVPGVLYGGGEAPAHFSVDARELRHALHARGAVIELSLEGQSTPAVVKDTQMHPVRGETMHIDFVRVRLDVAIQSTVTVELTGIDDAPGTSEGGVLEQPTREVTVEALPNDIPEAIVHDVSGLEAGATLTLADLSAPANVRLVDDPETVIASITLPRLEVESDDVETETQVVGEGEGEAAATGQAPADAGEGADAAPDTTSE